MTSTNIRVTLAVLVVALGTFIGGGALLYVQRQRVLAERARSQGDARRAAEELRQQEERERVFPLRDAYKKAPIFFTSTHGERLYGRISPDGDAETVLAAVSAQALDSEIATNEKLADDIARAKQQYNETVRAAVATAAEYQSMLPNYGQNRYRDAANLQEVKVDIMQKQQPKFEAALKAAENEHRTARARLKEQNLIFPVPQEMRVRVLDISDHYAKVQGLDGELADKVFFVTPDRLLVK